MPAGPALDLDFLLDYVMHEVKPLDWEAVLNCGVPLKVPAASAIIAILDAHFISSKNLLPGRAASCPTSAAEQMHASQFVVQISLLDDCGSESKLSRWWRRAWTRCSR